MRVCKPATQSTSHDPADVALPSQLHARDPARELAVTSCGSRRRSMISCINGMRSSQRGGDAQPTSSSALPRRALRTPCCPRPRAAPGPEGRRWTPVRASIRNVHFFPGDLSPPSMAPGIRQAAVAYSRERNLEQQKATPVNDEHERRRSQQNRKRIAARRDQSGV